jgi:superoxide dismutase, Cu-Zn family
MRNPIAFLVVGTLLSTACGDGSRREPGTDRAAGDTAAAGADTASGNVTAQVRDASGKELGSLTLSEIAGKIAVAGRLTGLPPGEHAIHLHSAGRCDPPKFEGAGDHWNPTNAAHGTRNPKGPHLGDLPNLTVGRDSSTPVQATSPGGTLRGQNPLLDSDGASVVVHAKADDYRSQPSGNSGDKIACGVVEGAR